MTSLNKRIAVVGNAIDGLKFAGPFDSVQDAAAYMEQSGDPWQIADLSAPPPEGDYLEPELWQDGLTLTQIGVIDNGIDGKDVYVLVKRVDGECLSVENAEDYALSLMGRNCSGPGRVFCDVVRGYKLGSPADTCMCVAEIRYDN